MSAVFTAVIHLVDASTLSENKLAYYYKKKNAFNGYENFK